MSILGDVTKGDGNRDSYGSGTGRLQRLQATENGSITKIFAWLGTASATPTSEQFRFVIYRGTASDPNSLVYYSPSNINHSGAGDIQMDETLGSPISMTAGEYLWVGTISVSGDSQLLYTGQTGGRIMDAPGAGNPAPSDISGDLFDGYRYGSWLEYTAGGGGGDQTLTPSLFTQPKTFYSPTVLPGAATILPSLFTQTKTFFSPVVTTGALTLQPPLLSVSKTFFSATVTRKSITSIGSSGVVRPGQTGVAIASENMGTLTSVAVNGVTVTSLSASGGSGTFTMPALTDGQISGLFGTGKLAAATNGTDVVNQYIVDYQPPTGFDFVTLSGTINQTETGVGYGFSPALAVNDQILFDPTKGYVDEQGNHYTDTPETQLMWHIEAATGIARSFNYTAESVAQTLSPTLHTREKSFYSAVVTTGAVNVAPPLLTNTPTFYSPTVTPGAVSVTPPLLTQTKIFYGASVSANTQFIDVPLLTQTKTIYAPSVEIGPITLLPNLYTHTKTIFSPVVTGGAVSLLPPLIEREKILFEPVVTPGDVTLAPSLFTNVKTIFEPSVSTGSNSLQVPLLVNEHKFFRAVVWNDDYINEYHPRKTKISYGSRVVKIRR
jgi:hypothetical protein